IRSPSDVDVDAAVQEDSNRFQVAGARRKGQRGKSRFRMRLEIRFRLDERLKHLLVSFRGGPHQRRLMMRRLRGVYGGAPRAQAASAAPAVAQVINGVSPVAMGASGFASTSRSRLTNAALPLVHACERGVMRRSLAAFGSAPARTSSSPV